MRLGRFQTLGAPDLHCGGKETALALDLGRWVRPVVTPGNPERVLAILRECVSGLWIIQPRQWSLAIGLPELLYSMCYVLSEEVRQILGVRHQG